MKDIKYMFRSFKNFGFLLGLLIRKDDMSFEMKCLTFPFALVLTPTTLMLCTMYWLGYYLLYFVAIIPAAWIAWYLDRKIRKFQRKKRLGKYTLK